MNPLAAALVAVVGLTLAAPAAHADVVPAGLKRIPVQYRIKGTERAEPLHLMRVTTNYRGYVSMEAVTADGRLEVPSGYMNSTRLVALTDSQREELAALRKGRIVDYKKIKAFIDRDDVASSRGLGYRTTISQGSPAVREVRHLELVEVGGGEVTLRVWKTDRYNREGDRLSAVSGALPVGLAGGGLALLFFGFVGRGRRGHSPGQVG